MEKVVHVMTRLCTLFPGADVPLIYSTPKEGESSAVAEHDEGKLSCL